MNNRGYANSIEPFSVKIVDSLSGSGVLVKVDAETCYMITARHNFKIDENKTFADVNIDSLKERLDSIEINKDTIDKVCKLDELLFHDETYDLLVFSTKVWSPYIKGLETISIERDYNENSNFFFYGYPNDNQGTPRGDLKHQGHVENESHIFRLERTKDDDDDFLAGFSGSGVFTKSGDSYNLVGIFIKFEEEKGKYYYAVDLGKIIDEINSKLDVSISIINGQEKIESLEQDIKSSNETLALKALLEDMPIEKLKIKAYKYLPISYFSSLPDTIDGIIDRLLELSMLKEGCVPIIALFEKHPDKIVIDFVQYLKRVKFSHIKNFTCTENPEVEELSLLINISLQDGTDKFKVETWRYANSETHRIFDDILEIDLDNHIELNNFLDKVYDYLEEAQNIYKSNIFIELILPNERVYQSFKAWENSKGVRMIRKYYYVHRLQSRFLQPDDNWKNKWKALEDERINIVNNTKFIEGFSYNNELSNANYKVVLKEKIENETLLFSDMEEFGIPILLSSLSKVCNVKEIKDFEFKGCQNKICDHIMTYQHNEKSDIFFMVDNPNKIPNEFKNPEQNQYDW